MNRIPARTAISLGTALIVVLAGCGGKPASEEKTAPPAARNALEITAAPELLKQLEIGEPVWAQVVGTLHVAGRVEADESRIARVGAPATGRLVDLDVVEGQTVRRGQVIAMLRSTELSNRQFEFLKALSQQQLATRAVQRAKHLLQAGVIGEAELQRREAEMSQASAELSASRDELRVLGMSDDALAKLEATRSVNSITPIVATINGTVLQRPVTNGQMVQSAETVVVLADLSQVWLVADVPEQTAGHLAAGRNVKAEIAALPEVPIHGKLTFVSATVNPETRTVRARMDLPNPGGRFKPSMLATMLLEDSGARQLVIPASAVVRENGNEYVFVQAAPARFVLRRVDLGAEYERGRVLLDGINAGEKIVLDGAFHLNNERRRQSLQGGGG